MYWLARPPYLRYAGAAGILLLALWIELRPASVSEHPFAIADVASGTELADIEFEWLEVPDGLLAPVTIEGRLSTNLEAGEPVLPSHLGGDAVRVPDGWWSLEIPVPATTSVGQPVMLVIRPLDPSASPITVDGIVVAAGQSTDPLSLSTPAAVIAVAGENAAVVAVAVGDRRVTVLSGGSR